MPYVNSDGSISNSPPFLKRIQNGFWGFVDFITIFFRTLLPLPAAGGQSSSSSSTGSRRSGNGGPPQRRMGGFKTMSDCRAPMPGGG